MRDFTDDLKALRARLDEAHTLPAHRRDPGAPRRARGGGAGARPVGRPGAGQAGERRLRPGPRRRRRVRQRWPSSWTTPRCSTRWPARRATRPRSPRSRRPRASLNAQLDELELRSLFTGEHDEADAICAINAKDGGVDAQDWAEMLLRMYTRWAERRGFDVEIDDVSEGTEAGILSAEFTIRGRYAYGLMQAERGTHRLVRISPFDGNARRQTSASPRSRCSPSIDEHRRRRDRRQGPPRRHLPLVGRRRPARQQDVVGHPHHPPARPASSSPARTSAASSRTGPRRWRSCRSILAARGRGGARGRAAADRRRPPGPGRLGQPDPLLRAAAVPAGEGPAHRPRGRQRAGRARRRPRRLHGGLPALEAAERRRRRADRA